MSGWEKKPWSPIKFYALDGEQVVEMEDVIAWGKWLEDANRIVDFTQINSEVTVSTVFLGLDHRFFGDGPPIVFETLIFGGPLDGDGNRYSSWDDAVTGHRAFVRLARAYHKDHQKT